MKTILKILLLVLLGLTVKCVAQVDKKSADLEKNILLLKIVQYPSIFGWTTNLPNEQEKEFIFSKFSQLLSSNLVLRNYEDECDSEQVLGEIYFGYQVKSHKTSKQGHWIINGVQQRETTREYWRTMYKFCLNTKIPPGQFTNWEFIKEKFKREQPDFDPVQEPIEFNQIWDSIPVFSVTPVNKSSLYCSFSLGIILCNGMPGARWDLDFYRKKSPFGVKFGLRQVGSRSFATENYNGYFYDVSCEMGVFGAVKNRTNRFQLFAALDIGNSQIENDPSENKKYNNDFWFAPVLGLQYYRTNIGLNGISITARIVKPISNVYCKNPYFEFGFGFTWGGMIKSPVV